VAARRLSALAAYQKQSACRRRRKQSTLSGNRLAAVKIKRHRGVAQSVVACGG